MPAKNKNRTQAYTALIIVAAIWGITTAVIKYALKTVGPFTLLFFRLSLAAAAITPLLFLEKKSIKQKLDIPAIVKQVFLGLLATTITLSLFFVGFDNTSAMEGAIISLLGPILIVIGGALFLKETITRQERWGIIVAFIGSALIVIEPILVKNGETQAGLHIFGNILIMIANISWATYTLLSKKFGQGSLTTTAKTAISFAAGSITSLPLAILEQGAAWKRGESLEFLTVSLAPWLPILYLAIFASVIGYFLYEWGLQRIEASEATIFSYLQPIFTLPAAFFLLGEFPKNAVFWLGAFIVCIGVLITEWRKKSDRRAKTGPTRKIRISRY